MEKYLKISEYIWLATAIISVGIVTYVIATEGFEENTILLLLPLMSGVMWFLRRNRRLKFEKENKK